MKCKSLALVLALVMVVLLSFGGVSHAEATEESATKKIWLTDGEKIFKTDTENVLEEGLTNIYIGINPLEEVKEFSYIFDEGTEKEYKDTIYNNLQELIRYNNDFTIGERHTVRCLATYNDGTTIEKFYTFKSIAKHKNYDQLCVNVSLNDECMYQKNYYNVKEGDVISVDVETFVEELPVCFTAYYWADADTWEALTEEKWIYGEDGTHLQIEVPEEYYGTRKALMVESVLKTNEGKEDPTCRSGWMIYFLNFADSTGVVTKLNDQLLYDSYTYLVRGGDKITAYGIPMVDSEIDFISYHLIDDWANWYDYPITKVDGSSFEITLPDKEPGTEMYLYVEPVDDLDNGRNSYVTKTGWQKYILVWADDTPITDKEVLVKYGDNYLEEGSTTEVSLNDYLSFSATNDERVFEIDFKWDDENSWVFYGLPANLKIPSDFSVGSTHKLKVRAVYDNEGISDTKIFYVTITDDNVEKD